MQKLVTREILKSTPRLYETEGQGHEATVTAHYFSTFSGWDWYMTELDPETGEAFGLAVGFARELGYFSIREFEEINRRRGFEFIERDTGFRPCKLSEVA